jgi:two-component system response regulator AtoC
MGLSILLIDDDVRFAEHLAGTLRKEGHQVEHAPTGARGLELFGETQPDLVLLDLVLPDVDGLDTLERIKQKDERACVMVMTAHASIQTAVTAMRLGGADYVVKPIELEALILKLEQAERNLSLRSDLRYLLEKERRGTELGDFVGSCPPMQEVYDKIRQVAKTDNTTVLVTGESGTGKELVARAIHALSARRDKPLIQLDCTAIPLGLLESELFGHERGAFSGADRTRRGLLELAHGGTILLDEIGDMDPTLQAKLLRVVEERRLRRVGAERDLPFDVRIIAATNQDLVRLADEGRFRRELLYRLKVFEIQLPPLRERSTDVLELAELFIGRYARSLRKSLRGLDDEARDLLSGYSFPGNVRELRNIIEQAVILATGELITRDLLPLSQQASRPPPPTARPAKGLDLDAPKGLDLDALGAEPLLAAERALVAQALRKAEGNKRRAAALLGVSRFALQRMMTRLGLHDP